MIVDNNHKVVVIGSIHHKNIESLKHGIQHLRYFPEYNMQAKMYLQDNLIDVLMLPSSICIDESTLLDRYDIHCVLYGPHFFAFITNGNQENPETKKLLSSTFNLQSGYITLNPQNTKIIHFMSPQFSLQCIPKPFGITNVSYQEYNKQSLLNQNECGVTVYFKQYDPNVLEQVLQFLHNTHVSHVDVIYYEHYVEKDYIKSLYKNKYTVWIGRVESQGFALMDAWSCNKPTFIIEAQSIRHQWNMQGLPTDDYPPNIPEQLYKAPTCQWMHPLCGHSYTWSDDEENKTLMQAWNHYVDRYEYYQPRKYIQQRFHPTYCYLDMLYLLPHVQKPQRYFQPRDTYTCCIYKVEGTSNIDTEQCLLPEYNNVDTWPSFFQDVFQLKRQILDAIQRCKPLHILRLHDGEFHFLNRKPIGNIPLRHCSKDLTSLNMFEFIQGVQKADIVCTLLPFLNDYQQKVQTITERKIDMPSEIIYALTASKWFLELSQTFTTVLIGDGQKLDIINQMKQFKQYNNTYNFQIFKYIHVPSRFTCDSPQQIIHNILSELPDTFDICLYGLGIGKLAIMHRVMEQKPGVYIDIGCGISALAGLVDVNRPYFGSWVNYALPTQSLPVLRHSNLDKMDVIQSSVVTLKQYPKVYIHAPFQHENKSLCRQIVNIYDYEITENQDEADYFLNVYDALTAQEVKQIDLHMIQPHSLYYFYRPNESNGKDIVCEASLMKNIAMKTVPEFQSIEHCQRNHINFIYQPLNSWIDKDEKNEKNDINKPFVLFIASSLFIYHNDKRQNERVTQYYNGMVSLYENLQRLSSDQQSKLHILFMDNTCTKEIMITKTKCMYDILQKIDELCSLSIVCVHLNTYGKLNKGAGLVDCWMFTIETLLKYPHVIHFEPRQQILPESTFIQDSIVVKDAMTQSRPSLSIFKYATSEQDHYYTGLFLIPSVTLYKFCQEFTCEKLVNEHLSIEYCMKGFITEQNEHHIIIDHLHLLRFDQNDIQHV